MAKSPENTTEEELVDAVEAVEEALEDEAPEEDIEDAEVVEGPEDEVTEAPEPETEELSAAEPDQKATPAGAGFLPLLLGGVAAAAIGYAFAIYGPTSTDQADMAAALEQQADQIAALDAKIDEPAPAPDLSGIEGQISALSDQLGSMSAEVAEQMAGLDARIIELEKQPLGDGTLSDTALAAYQAELDALRAELDAQQDAVMSAASQAEADLAAAREEAERLEQEALAAAEAANVRAAINRIAAAVETGAPFGDALAGLDTDAVPAPLTAAAETGVATNADLVAAFPEAARSALAVARSEGLSDDAGGLGGFLRQQFDVRSTTPQEGDGPDAVLSRAEAAVKEGRVADALAEIDALPEVVRAEITDWTARAQERSDVLDAIATLTETYN